MVPVWYLALCRNTDNIEIAVSGVGVPDRRHSANMTISNVAFFVAIHADHVNRGVRHDGWFPCGGWVGSVRNGTDGTGIYRPLPEASVLRA